MNAKQDKETDIAKVLEVDNLRAKQKIPKKWIIAAVLVSVIIIVAVFWRGYHSSNAIQYKTEEVKRGNLTVIVTATGTLKPTNNEVRCGQRAFRYHQNS
jgi:HlyD family secretion protein